jgi:hypothetical protein
MTLHPLPPRKLETVYVDPEVVNVVIQLTRPQLEKLERLNGSRFVQAMLDQAIANEWPRHLRPEAIVGK